MTIGIDSVLLLIHVIFFCYWLGADLGVFYSARFMVDPKLSPEARMYATRIMRFVDQAPRVSMAGMVTVGATLGILRGYITVDPLWILPIWIVGIAWVGMVIFLYVNEHHPDKIALAKKIDFNLRVVMAAFLIYLGVASLMEKGVTAQNWLALKILAFAGTMVCGIFVRIVMKPFGPPFAAMLKGTATPEQVATAQISLGRAKIFVMGIWILVTVAAALGLWKPV